MLIATLFFNNIVSWSDFLCPLYPFVKKYEVKVQVSREFKGKEYYKEISICYI